MSPTKGSEDNGGTASLKAVTFFCRRLFLLLVSLDVLLHIFQATMGKEGDAGDVSLASFGGAATWKALPRRSCVVTVRTVEVVPVEKKNGRE